METALFADAAEALIATARAARLCLMCAETEPADCHRSHISDWLVGRGQRVVHLITPGLQRGARSTTVLTSSAQ